MYREGDFIFYRLQFFGNTSQVWGYLDIGHALFERLSFVERQGEKGAEYRELLNPTHDAWQECGEHAFFKLEDAEKVIAALKVIRPDLKLRLVRVMLARHTQVVA